MFEASRKSTNLTSWSDSQEELHETQPVSPPARGNCVKKNKKQRKKASISVPQLCNDEAISAHRAQSHKEKITCEDEPIVRGIFKIGKKSHDVVLTATRLTWTRIQPETPTGGSMLKAQGDFVDMKDVFAVKVKRRRSAGQQGGGTLLGLVLFICRRKGAKLKDHVVHLNNLSEDHCEVWFKQLKDILNGFQSRPKSLKVFVNPVCHRKEAHKIYLDQVCPLFKLADIQTDVTITEGRGHALSILLQCSLGDYDGVVCVGGDGSVAEVAHGLLLRAQMDAGRDTDSIFMPVQAALPLGVIPAGSTDVVACSAHGVRHPVTAAMHIIMGYRRSVPMCSISSVGSVGVRLLRFSFSAMFGFGGHTQALADTHRWIPPSQRQDFALIKTLANLKPEDCEFSFITCSGGASGQSEAEEEIHLEECGEETLWQTRRGLYLNISIMSIPCLCSVAPRGLAPFTSKHIQVRVHQAPEKIQQHQSSVQFAVCGDPCGACSAVTAVLSEEPGWPRLTTRGRRVQTWLHDPRGNPPLEPGRGATGGVRGGAH
ncbi:ceramide kinase-like protein isoform X2 [Brachyhypopomus gauderio]|uniref:ceramide kinase-like protein isoform X2 n=1 Tax=Brachyhypopomus gauderio TaxID=698409 RepID=UPI00404211D9